MNSHAAPFGVFGMLALAVVVFGLRALATEAAWARVERLVRFGFYLRRGRAGTSGPEKSDQVRIEPVFVRVGESVRAARVDLQGRVPDDSGGCVSRGADWHDGTPATPRRPSGSPRHRR